MQTDQNVAATVETVLLELEVRWKQYRNNSVAGVFSTMERMSYGGRAGGILEAIELLRKVVVHSRNPCEKIFSHKWLDPECVENGCKSLCIKENAAKEPPEPQSVLDSIGIAIVKEGDADMIHAATESAHKRGLRLATISNTGLEKGFLRLTFYPRSVFTASDSDIKMFDEALIASSEHLYDLPVRPITKLLFSPEWLKEKIMSDSDVETEGGVLHPEAPMINKISLPMAEKLFEKLKSCAPVGWTTMFAGKRLDAHGVVLNIETIATIAAYADDSKARITELETALTDAIDWIESMCERPHIHAMSREELRARPPRRMTVLDAALAGKKAK